MFFAWDITIPLNTLEASPIEQTLKICKGVITSMWVGFPSGCNNMVMVQLLRSEHQLVPLNRGYWLIGNAHRVETDSSYEMSTVPYQLKFRGCSPGTTYAHVITVQIQVLAKEIAYPYLIMEKLLKKLRLI
jgi:hypothetical protein